MGKGWFHRFFRILYGVLAAAVLAAGLLFALQIRRQHRFDGLIVEAARRHGVDARLISAVIRRESRFNPGSVGRHGEVGLMQLMPQAAQDWARAAGRPAPTREELFDPAVNIDAGTWYLARALKFWAGRDDPVPFALAEYNAGRTAVQRWAANDAGARQFIGSITYPTTQRYVRDILRHYR